MNRIIPGLFKWLFLAALVILGAAFISARAILKASLPREAGEALIPGLSAPVDISRDSRGVPRIRASGAEISDALAALGFLHAQDRYFQMDLMRRRAAGELAELLGPAVLSSDREMRRYRFRSVAERLLPLLPEHHQRWLEAYTRGVNAGLNDLAARPPEYLLLFQRPKPWKAEDCLLVAFAMHHGLSMGARFELQNEILTTRAPRGVAEFLMPETSRFDYPLIGPPGNPLPPVLIPGPEALKPWDAVPASSGESTPSAASPDPPLPLGSNNFAVAGSKSKDGRAILANDMHLALSTPPTWYHAQIEWDGWRLVGVTLPGVPGVAAGSNGRLAWGHTNVTGDFEDFIRIEQHPSDRSRYRFGAGPDDFEPYTEIVEDIAVRGHAPERLSLRGTRWGIVSHRSARGEPLVLKWPALDPATVNLGILDMMSARTLEDGVEVASRWWGPPQNVLIASHDGRIAWVVSGWIPRRSGIDGRLPASWVAPGASHPGESEGPGWAGPIDESDRPRLIDPPDAILYSANARTLPLEQARLLGWCWASGERAARIAERLRGMSAVSEHDLLELQLDTRAAIFDDLASIILSCIGPDDADLSVRAARAAVESWNGRADAESVGFRVLERYASTLREVLINPLWTQGRARDIGLTYWSMQDEEPLRRILEERPPHFLAKARPDWDSFLREALRRSLVKRGDAGGAGPSGGAGGAGGNEYDPSTTWGDINRVRIAHPFSLAVPALGMFLNMPEQGLPGHLSTVRVQGRAFGASQRMVVSPGREEDGILHMPAGQSGHPLSPHYSDGHAAWVMGEPRPILSGSPRSTYRLVPPR